MVINDEDDDESMDVDVADNDAVKSYLPKQERIKDLKEVIQLYCHRGVALSVFYEP